MDEIHGPVLTAAGGDWGQPDVPVALLPVELRRLADAHLPAHIRNRLAGIPLLECKQDRFLGERGLLHRFLSLSCNDPGSTFLQF